MGDNRQDEERIDVNDVGFSIPFQMLRTFDEMPSCILPHVLAAAYSLLRRGGDYKLPKKYELLQHEVDGLVNEMRAHPVIRTRTSTERVRKFRDKKRHDETHETHETHGNAETHKEKKEGRNEGESVSMPGDTHTEAPTLDNVRSWAAIHFCPVPSDDFLAEFHRRMTERGWIDDRNRPLGRGWTRALSAWWAQEKKNISARVVQAEAPRGADGVLLSSPDPNEVIEW